VGKEGVCEETSVCVFSISILWGLVWWYLHVAGCVLQGLGRVFSGVLSPCGGPGLVFSCGYPMWVAGCLDMRRGVEKSVITQVYSATDDGCKGRPKHVEHTCSC